MASYFIYDSINQYRSDNTISEGTFTGTTFTVNSSALTNHERAADQNIGTINCQEFQRMMQYVIKLEVQ